MTDSMGKNVKYGVMKMVIW